MIQPITYLKIQCLPKLFASPFLPLRYATGALLPLWGRLILIACIEENHKTDNKKVSHDGKSQQNGCATRSRPHRGRGASLRS